MKINVKIDQRVFNDAYVPHFNNTARTQIFYGGASSGKSVFVAQRLVYDILNGGRNYLVCRAVGRDSRRSTWVEVNKVIRKWGVSHLFEANKSELVLTCANGYQVIFTGLDDTEKLKSITPKRGAITDIWVEEATQTTQSAITQLRKRQRGGDEGTPKRLTLTFNPIYQTHWIYDQFFKPVGWGVDTTEYTADDLTILKTWYVHNKFLTAGDIYDLENEPDEYYRDVYTYGNWGVLGDSIFTNWKVEPCKHTADSLPNYFGLDFGYASDPAALACVAYDAQNKTIYIYDEAYERGLTNDKLAALVLEPVGTSYVTTDSSEPKSIEELRMHGVSAVGAKKGKDSVWFGIQWLKQHTIVIDPSCVNAQNEFRIYQWKKDREGNSLPVPVDKFNHLIDALRYALESLMVYQPAIW